MLGQSISKNSLILGIFAAITAAIIAMTFQGTQKRIEEQERKAASAALIDMIPYSRHNNDMLTDLLPISLEQSQALGFTTPVSLNIAKQDGKVVAFVIPTIAHDGYSGDIKMIVAVNVDGTLAGVRVLAHKETPGLGDKIDLRKSQWIHSFDGKSLAKPQASLWTVKKDGGEFDQFTGATITPRAVVMRVKTTLQLWQANKALWIKQANQITQSTNAKSLTTAKSTAGVYP